MAALVVAAGGAWFAAPAQAAGYSGGMTGPPFSYSGGQCPQPAGAGDFCIFIGDSVTWTNHSATDHTVTGDSFGDKTHIPKDGTFSHTFTNFGTFPYHCDIHSYMTGTVNVAEHATTTTTEAPATTQPPAATTTVTKPTTTTSSTVRTTTTTDDLGNVFSQDTTPTDPTTTLFTTETTRALGAGGGGTSAGLVAMLVLGLGAVGTVVALIIRRMRVGTPPS